MKKLIILLIVLLLSGCGSSTSKTNDGGSVKINVYMNNDSNCVGTKRIEKDYEITDPDKILEEVDYCFIGTIKELKESEIYDDGKIRTSMTISVKSSIKGDAKGSMEVYRDGGNVPINDYINYPKDTCLNKGTLNAIPENMRNGRYVEVIPSAYFEAEENVEYLFFVKNDENKLEVYNDAYGMLKILDDENVQNIYTNEKYKISEFAEM
jgi:hypothetical protein